MVRKQKISFMTKMYGFRKTVFFYIQRLENKNHRTKHNAKRSELFCCFLAASTSKPPHVSLSLLATLLSELLEQMTTLNEIFNFTEDPFAII